ncbi:MAG: YceI family protein [Ferruginibacter sp.]
MSILGFCMMLSAQSIYKIDGDKDNDIKLSGTSTFHNWAMNAQVFTSNVQFDFSPGNNKQITAVKSLTFSLETKALKSGENGLDKNAYKALKTDQYNMISYKLLSAKVVSKAGNKYMVKTQGYLIIAGVTKLVKIDVYCIVNNDASITCTGSDKLNMSDYNVKPPSFMFGAMKTGNAIVLDFTFDYKK